MACNWPPAHHPRSFSRIGGVHTHCNLVTPWCAGVLLHSTESAGHQRRLPLRPNPPALSTRRISISDHGLRVHTGALIIDAAATARSPRPTADYRQAASGPREMRRDQGTAQPTRAASNETLPAAHRTAHLNSVLSQGFVEARALASNQATSYCNATPPKQNKPVYVLYIHIYKVSLRGNK